MDMHLRNGKVVQPPPEPNAGKPNIVVSNGTGLVHTSQRSIGYEDGKNMRNFLDLVELDFIERGLEKRQWGEELKRYLTGDALGYWLYLRRTGVPLTDWEQLRQRFCAQFCNITKERMKVMIAENVWRGDHQAYSARFAAIVAQGVSMAPDLLVGYYLANLPVEIYREITRGGTRKLADWQEAAAALATTAAPWRDSCEDRLRFQRDLEDAKRRWANGGREPCLQRERESRGNRRNDPTDSRCYACSGRGHVSRDCPLRNGATRRIGETCSRCGGRDHYARDCPTPADPTPTPSSPVLDWPAAYSKCPVFSEPYNAASTKPGEVVQLEFQHRRHTFRFVLPY
ncbi:hypothetical protein, conserved [Eimeria necatrix]|uniref:CCHC-type domain-containing protein n=1 Tax=Eimeria necatrix TaxID=51315 RepID=U6MLR2_9EIME|nr:hypothetical protein, conserved [Eimeria necatrix]CDJ65167.1 hypothetical protein, conserved [Eimeria necatrix]